MLKVVVGGWREYFKDCCFKNPRTGTAGTEDSKYLRFLSLYVVSRYVQCLSVSAERTVTLESSHMCSL